MELRQQAQIQAVRVSVAALKIVRSRSLCRRVSRGGDQHGQARQQGNPECRPHGFFPRRKAPACSTRSRANRADSPVSARHPTCPHRLAATSSGASGSVFSTRTAYGTLRPRIVRARIPACCEPPCSFSCRCAAACSLALRRCPLRRKTRTHRSAQMSGSSSRTYPVPYGRPARTRPGP